MTKQELEKLCQPLTPEEALDTLRNLYDGLSNSPGWVSDEELVCLNAAIEVMKTDIKKGAMHEGFTCYMGWREKPLGTGEAAVIVIPLEEDELTDEQLGKLMDILQVTTFSEETIDFTIQELDRVEE